MTSTAKSPTSEQSRRKRGAAKLATLVPGTIEPVMRQRGFANATVMTEWAEIAGPHLARVATPLELRWPKRRPEPETPVPARSVKREKAEKGVLVLGVAGAFALEVQMASARLIEALNRRLGFDCVGSIQIRQGALPKAKAKPRLSDDPALIAKMRAELGDIDDERLRDALAALGAAVKRKKQ